MLKVSPTYGKFERFAPTRWTEESSEWQTLDLLVAPDHLVRRIDSAVDMLDLEPLFDSYRGVGKKAVRPDLLLKLVIFELHNNRPSPAQWAQDIRDSIPARWLLCGSTVSRARLYDFRDRIAPFLQEWNAQVLQIAVATDMTSATRVALDSSSVAAAASRKRLVNEERCQRRLDTVNAALVALQRGEPLPENTDRLNPTETGLRLQKQRYERAAEVLRERQAENLERTSKRKPSEKIFVSSIDPESVLGRDKLNVFRPLYNVELIRDLDSPLVFAYDVLAQINENGVITAMVDQMVDQVGHKPAELLVDSGYVSIHNAELCDQAGIILYGPCQENDYSKKNGKKKQENQHTELPKSEFRWIAAEEKFVCPEGHDLNYSKTITQKRVDHVVTLDLYVCSPQHCTQCPLQKRCTKTPKKGRTVSRMEHEELLDELRARMQTAAAKELYRLRSQTVELNFADIKEHRGVRRFHCRTQKRALAEIGAQVLTHNLLFVQKRIAQEAETCSPTIEITQIAQAA